MPRRTIRRLTVAILATAALAAAQSTPAEPPPVFGVSEPTGDIELAFTVEGRVMDVPVVLGQRVEAGDILVRLDDREIAAAERLLQIRAESTLSVSAADAEHQLAINEQERVEDAFQRGAAARHELERAKLSVRRAEIALALANRQRKEAGIQLEQTVIRRESYTLRAPISGVIEELAVEAGETVERLQPILRLVAVDPIRVKLAAPLHVASDVRVGDRAHIAPATGSSTRPPLQGVVTHIAMVADAASDTRTLFVEAPNPDNRPAGARVAVRLEPAAETR